jgi:hypothetical protein
MDCVNSAYQLVNVIAFYFRGHHQPEGFPKRIEYNNQLITFTENGSRRSVVKGDNLVHVFDMTDGEADYQLEYNAETLNWALLSISGHSDRVTGLMPARLMSTALNPLA